MAGFIETLALLKELSVTNLSWPYIMILLSTGIVFEVLSVELDKRMRYMFACEGVGEGFAKTVCLVKYNQGPNDMQGWLYHVYFFLPFAIFLLETIVRYYKLHKYPNIESCKMHIHIAYFLRLVLLIVVHVVVLTLLVLNVEHIKLEDYFICNNKNSTLTCIDGEAKQKSTMRLASLIFTSFFILYLTVELVYYMYQWGNVKKERDNGDFCKICCLFADKFCHAKSQKSKKGRVRFFGVMSKEEAAEKLKQRKNGTFLIRNSVSEDGKLALSLMYNNEASHIMIKRSDDECYMISDLYKFNSIQILAITDGELNNEVYKLSNERNRRKEE